VSPQQGGVGSKNIKGPKKRVVKIKTAKQAERGGIGSKRLGDEIGGVLGGQRKKEREAKTNQRISHPCDFQKTAGPKKKKKKKNQKKIKEKKQRREAQKE